MEPSPSKIEKLSHVPTVSPSDKKKKASGVHGLKSKPRKSLYVEKSEGPEQIVGEKDVLKVYVSENAIDVDLCVEHDIGEIFTC